MNDEMKYKVQPNAVPEDATCPDCGKGGDIVMWMKFELGFNAKQPDGVEWIDSANFAEYTCQCGFSSDYPEDFKPKAHSWSPSIWDEKARVVQTWVCTQCGESVQSYDSPSGHCGVDA